MPTVDSFPLPPQPVTFADIGFGEPCALASDGGRIVHKVTATNALDVQAESVEEVPSAAPVYPVVLTGTLSPV